LKTATVLCKNGPGIKIMTQEIKSFPSAPAFRDWLATHHGQADGIWLRFFKKTSGEKYLAYSEALDEALCYGWIDGQAKAYDEQSWLQRFGPRRPASSWSKINTQHAERLIKAGRMTPAGLKQIETAKADGRWSAAYDSPRNAAPPGDFLTELDKNKKAKAFFATLNKANIYAIVYRLQTAKKPETRQRRLKMILGMLSRGEKFHL
jgi:uncharacterized protein YdeI (YjbR/CyaY-like superfamily)